MTMSRLDPGQMLKVITNDMSTKESVPALCSNLGYTLLEVGREEGAISFTIHKMRKPRSLDSAEGTGE